MSSNAQDEVRKISESGSSLASSDPLQEWERAAPWAVSPLLFTGHFLNQPHGNTPVFLVQGEKLLCHADDIPHTYGHLQFCQFSEVLGFLNRLQYVKIFDHRPAGGGGFFYLDRRDHTVLIEQEVDLFLILVTVVKDRRLFSGVQIALVDLGEHIALKECPGHGASLQGLRIAPFQQVGGKAGVQKMQQGHFDDTLEHVIVIRLYQGGNVGRD